MHLSSSKSQRGFTIVDLMAVLAVLISLTAIAAPTLNGAWNSRLARGSANNLHIQGIANAMYSKANADRIATYTWRGPLEGEDHVDYTLPNGAVKRARTGQAAAGFQNEAILMRMTGRLEGVGRIREINVRLVHRRFTHLVLMDFMGFDLSDEVFVDPADANMLQWHRNPLDYQLGSSVPYANSVSDGFDQDDNWSRVGVRQRWAFSPSYFTVPTAWMGQGPAAQYAPLAQSNHLMLVRFGPSSSNTLYLGNTMSQVSFPSAKVFVHEEYDRRQGAIPTHYAYDFARPMKLMFDGSLNLRPSGEAGSSVNPSVPSEPWTQTYIPLPTYPLPFGGIEDPTLLDFRYRWSAFGLSSVDYTP